VATRILIILETIIIYIYREKLLLSVHIVFSISILPLIRYNIE